MDIQITQSEIERLKYIIEQLHSNPETKQIAVALAYTNRFLHEVLIEEACKKDEYGIYYSQEDYKEIRTKAIAEGWEKK